MTRSKILIISPCQGAYGGIEAFVFAVADAMRSEPDFEVRLRFKRVKGFAFQPSMKAMLKGQDADFVHRADRDLLDAIRWADLVHLQNASPDVVALAKLFRKPLAALGQLVRRDPFHQLGWFGQESNRLRLRRISDG